MSEQEKIKILVVDDESVVLRFFRRLLREYDVTTVGSAKEALSEIQQKDFDLMFIDILMKEVSGLELTSQIRKIRPNAEIVLITGDPLRAEVAKDLSVRTILLKPFAINELLSEIERVKRLKGQN